MTYISTNRSMIAAAPTQPGTASQPPDQTVGHDHEQQVTGDSHQRAAQIIENAGGFASQRHGKTDDDTFLLAEITQQNNKDDLYDQIKCQPAFLVNQIWHVPMQGDMHEKKHRVGQEEIELPEFW